MVPSLRKGRDVPAEKSSRAFEKLSRNCQSHKSAARQLRVFPTSDSGAALGFGAANLPSPRMQMKINWSASHRSKASRRASFRDTGLRGPELHSFSREPVPAVSRSNRHAPATTERRASRRAFMRLVAAAAEGRGEVDPVLLVMSADGSAKAPLHGTVVTSGGLVRPADLTIAPGWPRTTRKDRGRHC